MLPLVVKLCVILKDAPFAHLVTPFTTVVLFTRLVTLTEPFIAMLDILGPAACVKVLVVGKPDASVVLPDAAIVTLGLL
tara:strand:- start:129 stop:365 length:237 start_codon:yes stop_codon:yes gene_type:complete